MITNYPVLSRIGLLFLETVIAILSYLAANYIRNFLGLSTDLYWSYYWNLLLIVIIVWGGLSEYQQAYAGSAFKSSRSLSVFKSLKKEITIVFRTVVFGCLIIYCVSAIINIFTLWEVPKSLLVIFGVINIAMLSIEKLVLFQYIEYTGKKAKNIKKVLVLGTGDVAKHFLNSIDKRRLKVIGLISKEEHNEEKELFGYRIIGRFDSLAKTLNSNYIDELVITLSAKDMGDIEDVVSTCDKEGIPVRIVSPFFKNLISKSKAEVVYGIPNIIFLPVERNDLEMAIKRVVDIGVSFIGLVMLAPLFVLIIILIKLDSAGPVFYKWKIFGLNKKPLTSYKFRTMVVNADALKAQLMKNNEMTGAVFKMKNDPRITRIGRWFRKYSLDELPQLWSVFKGDLSLVGPRPPLQAEVEFYEGWHRRKLSVKPGITCLWQISGRNEITDFDEWMSLDLKYIDEWTLWLDLKILFKTFFVMVRGTGR
jgi:exopolysaccharide biosynthesis polyprenyl glycosylphosphotransferase